MKKFQFFVHVAGALALTAMANGCKKEEPPVPMTTPAEGEKAAGSPEAALPPGHPPMGENAPAAMPPGHPPIGANAMAMPGAATAAAASEGLAFTAPAEWVAKPARSMLWKVFGLPKVAGDAEDGELTISSLAANIPLDANVQRWCGQFDLEGGKLCKEAALIRDLPGTAFPTKIIEIAGALKSSSMTGPAGAPKAGWRMVVAEITMPGRAWYLKMTGPANTVAKWQDAYLKALSAIK